MSDLPKVSVLIPCYNAERWIGQSLNSVLEQTWPNLEVVVVDDGSTDGSIDVVRSFEGRGVRLVRQSNKGASSARNRALACATGDYIQFLDADDLISSDKIAVQVARLAAAPHAVATCRWGRFYGAPIEAKFEMHEEWRDLAAVDWLLATWRDGGGMLFPAQWLIPRRIVDMAGPWREDLTLNDDGEYFTRIVLAAGQVLFCESGLAYYRSGIAGSLSGTRSRSGWESGYRAIESCAGNVLRADGSPRVAATVSLLWQGFAHSSYPYARDLANRALTAAARLSDKKIKPEGGRLFRAVMAVFGWKVARVLQRVAGRA
jgi:glycosyltransferase involved in cell wall biosynthesis